MVDSKFDSSWGEWCSNEPLGLNEVGLWKNIKRGWGSFASQLELFGSSNQWNISFIRDA
jgi:hypothetical protein